MSNNQEMQFADPAWEPHKTQEAGQEEEMPPLQIIDSPALDSFPSGSASTAQQYSNVDYNYAQGYRAQTPPPGQARSGQQGSEPQFQQQPSYQASPRSGFGRVPPWVWFVVIIVALGGIGKPAFAGGGPFGGLFSLFVTGFIIAAIWLLFSRRVTINPSGERQVPETRTFAVGAHPTIIVNNKAGSIRLHAGQDGQVAITSTKRGYVFSQQWNHDSQISYSQDQSANSVSARVDGWRPFGKNAIDFDITVPNQANLEVVTNMGSVFVQNIAGKMKLTSDAGSITATQVTLQGHSRLKTDAGSISFAGSLDPSGDYELSTDLGNIHATLPSETSFSLDAKTDLGSVNTNLPIMQPQRNKAYGQVGSGPSPRLKVKTDVGSITVSRR